MKSLFNQTVDILSFVFCHAFVLVRASQWSARVTQRLTETTFKASDEFGCRFVVASPITLWRARTLLSKEPETIDWIRSFSLEDVFYDIGANIGAYSIFAGHKCRQVYAFEPESQNFALLNRNIALNGLERKVTAFPLAIAGSRRLDTLRLSTVSAGAALHSFGTNVDFKAEEFSPVFEQGSMSVTLDDLVLAFGLDFPTFIKIDVDGLEAAVLQEGRTILNDKRLKGVLVELNEKDEDDMAAIRHLEQFGLRLDSKGAAVTDLDGKFEMRNYIFVRDAR